MYCFPLILLPLQTGCLCYYITTPRKEVPVLLIHKGKQLVLGGERAITPVIKHRILGRLLGFSGQSNLSPLLLFIYWV